MGRLLLPDGIDACLFDLDGVITRTAKVHAAAWAEMFDDYLARRGALSGESHDPFSHEDYLAHVDGKLRLDGVRSFLASRGITLADGRPDDPPKAETIHALGARKNELFLEVLERDGVEVYESSVAVVDAARAAGLRTAIVSASRNCAAILDVAGLTDRFEVRIDGVVAAERGLPGKPAPDTYLAAAADLGVAPGRAVVIEDAVSGVEAGRAGDFGYVVGVDRTGNRDALLAAGADVVVTDLGELIAST